jgi:hypothetical protein
LTSKIFLIVLMCNTFLCPAQDHLVPLDNVKIGDSSVRKHRVPIFDRNGEIDLIDVGNGILNKHPDRHIDTSHNIELLKLHSAVLPGIGYSLQTGFAAVVQYLGGFYTTNSPDANQSSIESSVSYTQLNQLLIPLQCNIWTKENKFNITTDWRYLIFPQNTYGLGGYSSLNNPYVVDYSNIRLYTTAYKMFKPDMYFGIGYDFDYLWNIHEINPPGVTDFQTYNLANHEESTTGIASGPTLDFLYDTRRNSINPPPGGSFVNVVYRPSLTVMGSSENWQSLVVDVRKYIPFPAGSKNTIALWSYDWLTLSGAPPYVLLPNTGGDPYGNTGRGFTEGRFRGKDMLYYENEYRFGIMNNGFLGGVVFANAESFPEENTGQFSRIYAGYGAGIRIKYNKFSRTNVAIDYGFGSDGSRGVFINLGEVF